MADRTGIEWTDATWNPLRGCTRVSEGCRHCYAETVAARFSGPGQAYEGLAKRVGGEARWTGEVKLVEHMLDQPLRWNKPRRIFVNSMSDLFHENVPDEWIDRIFAIMAAAHWHTFQVLTKRLDRMKAYFQDEEAVAQRWVDASFKMVGGMKPLQQVGWSWAQEGMIWPLPNIWLGASVENQAAADERIPLLLDTPAAKHFVSIEPILGPVDLTSLTYGMKERDKNERYYLGFDALRGHRNGASADGEFDLPSLDWVICGGESGPGARPMHPEWGRALRDQCTAAGVPFFFKQWGEFEPNGTGHPLKGNPVSPHSSTFHSVHFPDGTLMNRVGKHRAGSLLDSIEHKAFPA